VATGTGIQCLGWHNNEGIVASLLSDQNMCNFYIWGTLWDKVRSFSSCY